MKLAIVKLARLGEGKEILRKGQKTQTTVSYKTLALGKHKGKKGKLRVAYKGKWGGRTEGRTPVWVGKEKKERSRVGVRSIWKGGGKKMLSFIAQM